MLFWDVFKLFCSTETIIEQIEQSPVSQERLIFVVIALRLVVQLVVRMGFLRRSAHGQIFSAVMSLCLTLAFLLLIVVIFALAVFCIFEVAFYDSPLVLLASTWGVIYSESYRAFRMSKSTPNRSLRQAAQMRNLPKIDRVAAEADGIFQADFFPRVLRLPSPEVLNVAKDCEERATGMTGTDDAAEREKRLLRHVAVFLRRHVLTRPEPVSPVQHPGLFRLHTPHALAGILVKYILRFPSLKHLEHPLHFAYFLPFILSIPGSYLVLHLVRVVSNAAALPVSAADVDLVPSLFTNIRFSAQAQGAILDAILEWKERKEEIELQRKQQRLKEQ
ncbi:hypothetical protein JCM8547_007759 [Rhodosporidiobolus lusitaniae]